MSLRVQRTCPASSAPCPVISFTSLDFNTRDSHKSMHLCSHALRSVGIGAGADRHLLRFFLVSSFSIQAACALYYMQARPVPVVPRVWWRLTSSVHSPILDCFYGARNLAYVLPAYALRAIRAELLDPLLGLSAHTCLPLPRYYFKSWQNNERLALPA